MVSSKARTVAQYLGELPEERRTVAAVVRSMLRRHLLVAQALYDWQYLTGASQDPKEAAALKGAFAKAGNTLDRGESCIRFRKLEDLPLPAIGRIIASNTPKKFIAQYEASRRDSAG